MPSTLIRNLATRAAALRTPAEREEYDRLTKAMTEQAQANWDLPEFHRQVAADISYALDWGFTNPVVGQVVDFRSVGENDVVTFKERRGLKAYWTAYGGEVWESQLRDEQVTLTKDRLAFHVSGSEDDARNNYGQTMADLVALGRERMDAEVNRRLLNLIQAAVPPGAPTYHVAAGLTQATLNAAIREVKDVARPRQGGGPLQVTILGRAGMTDKIVDFPGYAPETQEEIRRTGRLGVYRGANIVTLDHYTDDDDAPFVPANEMYVFASTAGLFARWGGVTSRQWVDYNFDYWHFRSALSVGGMITKPSYIHRFVDSSGTP